MLTWPLVLAKVTTDEMIDSKKPWFVSLTRTAPKSLSRMICRKLDLVVGAIDGLGEPPKDSLEKWREEQVENIGNLRLEPINDLV
ncbi:hypothetical protein PoMZ_00526 [Pyricularia oryzae]|uniref:Uncharacterized protein n=1 Tax=Pyricularia oryzae TaxID=318829 RepID=A0A4V1C597_PYROR|nr:hypothetical protein PoMZ_00526 [Pyricularia oryzae]